MKNITLHLAILSIGLLVLPNIGVSQCGGSVAIPDNNDGTLDFTDGFCSDFTFNPNGPLGFPVGVRLNINHTWQGDLTAWVESDADNCDAVLPLFSRPGDTICAGGCCGSGDDPDGSNLDFKDAGTLDPENGIIAAGIYMPNADCPGDPADNIVTTFGALEGLCLDCGPVTWSICISDGAGGDTGSASVNLLYDDAGTCVEAICGCIDPCAPNYDENANTDDGTCMLQVVVLETPTEDICSGETPTLPTVTNIPVPAAGGNTYTVSWYTVDADPGNCAVAGHPIDPTNAYTPVAIDNLTCSATPLTVYAYAQCLSLDTRGDTCADDPDCIDEFIYIKLAEFTITTYPDASNWVVTPTPGGCGAAASILIEAENGDDCFTMTGSVPPAGTCPSTDGSAPLAYNFDPGFPADCNLVFSGSVDAICAPVGCFECPDITTAITAQEICSGGDPDFATAESEITITGTPGEIANAGPYTYFIDAAFTMPYVGPLTNTGCASADVTIYGRLQCTDPSASGTSNEFDDFSFVVTVYPDVNQWTTVITSSLSPGNTAFDGMTDISTVSETDGCIANIVSIVAEDGVTECFTDMTAIPGMPTCDADDNPVDQVETLNWSYDPAFPAACNAIFSGVLTSTCTTEVCCDADAGTVSITSATTLCALGQGSDKLTVVTNNDFEDSPNDPCDLAGTPGVYYGVYSAPSTGDVVTNFTGAILGSGPVSDPGCLTQNIEYSSTLGV